MIIINSKREVEKVKDKSNDEFDTKQLGVTRKIIRIDIAWFETSENTYLRKVIHKFEVWYDKLETRVQTYGFAL